MRDLVSIYKFYTSISLEELHKRLLNGSIPVPGDGCFFISMCGELNSLIYLESMVKSGKVLIYRLMPLNKYKMGYKPITSATDHIPPLGMPLIYSPLEAFIRRFIIAFGKENDLSIFDAVVIKIVNGELKEAAEMYAIMSGESIEEARESVDALALSMKEQKGKKHGKNTDNA